MTRWKGRWWRCDRAFVIHIGTGAARWLRWPWARSLWARRHGARRRGSSLRRGTRQRPPSAGRTACPRGQLPVPPLPADKDAFGRALGRTSVAMCAVTDIGFAQSLVKKAGGGGRRGLRRGGRRRWTSRPSAPGNGKRSRCRREEPAAGKRRVHRQAAGGTGAPAGRPSGTGAQTAPAADRPDRVYKERSSRDAKSRRPQRKEAPGQRYENALPVKKGREAGSRPASKEEHSAARKRRDQLEMEVALFG